VFSVGLMQSPLGGDLFAAFTGVGARVPPSVNMPDPCALNPFDGFLMLLPRHNATSRLIAL